MNLENAIRSLRLYQYNRVPTGGFLLACLENNLREAFARADSESIAILVNIVSWLHWEMPGDMWGSRERVKAHLAKGIIHTHPEVVNP